MLMLKVDSTGALDLKLPPRNDKQRIVDLAEHFIEYDELQPASQQSSYLSELQSLIAQVNPVQTGQVVGRVSRNAASQTLNQLEAEARVQIEKAVSIVNAYYNETPEEALRWGLNVSHHGNILMPHRDDYVTFLTTYIETENGRSAPEQFATPDLAIMIALRDQIAAIKARRYASRQQYHKSTAISNELCEAIFVQLQGAAVELIIKRFGGEVRRELGDWGFAVTHSKQRANGRSSSSSSEGGNSDADSLAEETREMMSIEMPPVEDNRTSEPTA